MVKLVLRKSLLGFLLVFSGGVVAGTIGFFFAESISNLIVVCVLGFAFLAAIAMVIIERA